MAKVEIRKTNKWNQVISAFLQEGGIPCSCYRPWSVSEGCRQAMGIAKMRNVPTAELKVRRRGKATLTVVAGAGGEYCKHG